MFTVRVKALHPLPHLSNAVPSHCQAVQRCHVILSHYHQGVSVQLEMSCVASKLTTSYSQQLEMPPSHFTVPAQRQMSRQSNADQNPLLNTLPLVILLLFQKQLVDKTVQAQPTVSSSSQIINLLVLILITFYLQVRNQAFIHLTALSSNKVFIWRVFTAGFPL